MTMGGKIDLTEQIERPLIFKKSNYIEQVQLMVKNFGDKLHT